MVRQAHHERRKAAHPERVEGLGVLSVSAVNHPEIRRAEKIRRVETYRSSPVLNVVERPLSAVYPESYREPLVRFAAVSMARAA